MAVLLKQGLTIPLFMFMPTPFKGQGNGGYFLHHHPESCQAMQGSGEAWRGMLANLPMDKKEGFGMIHP